MQDSATAYRNAFLDALRPPPRLTVSEFADANRILTIRSTSEPGPWRTDRVPHLKEPMDLLSPHEKKIKRVILVFAAQGLAKTECGLNWLATTIALYPAPFIIMFPDEQFASKQMLQRIDPLLQDTPAVAAQVMTNNSKEAGNSKFLKLFKSDMILSVIGGHSGSAAQGMPACYVWSDETSSLPMTAGGQGDPLYNLETRQSNYGQRRKTLLTSTPGIEGECRITKEFLTRSDQRLRYITAPCCGAQHVMVWKDFVWDHPHPQAEVFWQCPSCGTRVPEYEKPKFLTSAEWRATADGDGETAGFHLPAWYSPYGWITWKTIKNEFLLAKDDRELLIAWVQKKAAEAFKEDTSIKFSTDDLMARRFDTSAGNGYASGAVPNGVVLITVGADVQGGGGTIGECVHAHVWGWGVGEECWHLAHIRIDGDPALDSTLNQLDILAGSTWKREDGAELGMSLGAIDQGGLVTEEIRRWCAKRVGRWVPIMGQFKPDSAIVGTGTGVMFNRHDRPATRSGDVLLFGVGYRRSVDLFQNRLKILQPGPGYVHLGAAATDQVVSELFPWRFVLEKKAGLVTHKWDLPSGQHDEAGDCWRYAYAAMELVRRRRFASNRDGMWEILAAAALATMGPKPEKNVSVEKKKSWLPDDRKGWLSR